MNQPNALNPYWLSYEISRQLQLAKALLHPRNIDTVITIVELNNIEKFRMIRSANLGGSAIYSSAYSGTHEPIRRETALVDVPDHDGLNRNVVPAVVADVMDEVSRIFSLSKTPDGVWDTDFKLAYVKGLENQR